MITWNKHSRYYRITIFMILKCSCWINKSLTCNLACCDPVSQTNKESNWSPDSFCFVYFSLSFTQKRKEFIICKLLYGSKPVYVTWCPIESTNTEISKTLRFNWQENIKAQINKSVLQQRRDNYQGIKMGKCRVWMMMAGVGIAGKRAWRIMGSEVHGEIWT